MKIGIIGVGVVGSAVKFGLESKRGHTIFAHDIRFENTSTEDVFKNSELIFLCLPTPVGANGHCDISKVENTCRELNALATKANIVKNIIIKSTVEPGTTNRLAKELAHLHFAFNPEFLKERAAIHDFCNQDLCVIGTEHDDLYKLIVDAHGNLAKEYCRTTPINAEFVKYFLNVFNSTRIIFANLFYDLAKKTGADYEQIKALAVKRYNMADYYLDCNDNLRGFGGVCLPKDTLAISSFASKLGLDYKFISGLLDDNNRLNREYPQPEQERKLPL